MALLNTLTKDIESALRGGDAFSLSVLRLLMASIKNYEIDKRGETISEEEIVALIAKQVKQRREAIDLYVKGNRLELADKEEKEIQILNNYLPQQMTPLEVESIVATVFNNLPDDHKKDFGKIMKAVMEQIKGRADGTLVANFVKEKIK